MVSCPELVLQCIGGVSVVTSHLSTSAGSRASRVSYRRYQSKFTVTQDSSDTRLMFAVHVLAAAYMCDVGPCVQYADYMHGTDPAATCLFRQLSVLEHHTSINSKLYDRHLDSPSD